MRVSGRLLVSTLVCAVGISAVMAPRAEGQAAGAATAPANKKELTLERLFGGAPMTGRLIQGIQWSPDGKRFSYLNRGSDGLELWTMDAATGEKKVLVSAATLKSVTQPEKAKVTQATGLGRVHPENYLWAPDAGSMLFIGTNSLVLLDLSSMTTKPIASSEAEIEDPKFSPESFCGERGQSRRAEGVDNRRQRRNFEGQIGLGVPGRTRLPHGVLVVAGFDEDRVLRDG
jgi:hypothetical protein